MCIMFLIYNCFFVTLFTIVNCALNERLVKIDQGILEGIKEKTTFALKDYTSFKGVPYAEPCVGLRKFDVARPALPWNGIHDASSYGKPCPQLDIITMQPTGDEDCLYLNVFTPNISMHSHLPVMIYFFAGLFQLGSADDEYYDPEFLMEKNVVVVTMNYRLGPLGFLSTMDGHAPGNVGMKDQVLALKWIKKNIIHFGGNPNNVTLFGQSSGATAVHLHMMSPMSKGLFHAAIIQSGSALSWWAISRDPRPDAFALGRALNIHTTSAKELVDGLKNATTGDIILAVAQLYEAAEYSGKISREDIFPFAPCVEIPSGQAVFLPDEPWTILRSGQIAEVPLMIGITSHEATVLNSAFIDEEIIELLIYYMCHVLKIRDPSEVMNVMEYAENFYLPGRSFYDIDEENLMTMYQLISDITINVETIMAAKIMTYRSAKDVFLYKFSYLSSFGFFKETLMSDTIATAHGDELTYLFHTHLYEHKQLGNVESQRMIDLMTKMWTNFARDWNPTSVQDEDINFTWEPLDGYNKYLNITLQPTMDKNLFLENVRLWAAVMKNELREYSEIFN